MAYGTFGSKILKYQDDIIKDLGEFIKIKSIAKAEGGTKEAPFGEEALKALKWILNRSEEMGFETKIVENKVGHAEYGEGDDIFAVVTHVDVVPVTDGWDTDPFELVEKDGVLYGRGVVDDKGPAIIALYAMKILKEEGILGKYKLRNIFGSGEEITAFELKNTYFKHEDKPTVSFTPDGDYGICIAGKGIIRFKIFGEGIKNSIVKKIKGGNTLNAVPYKTEAIIECSDDEYKNLVQISEQVDGKFKFEYNGSELNIECTGKAAHAMEPQKGKNSILNLVNLLQKGFKADKLGNFIDFISKKLGTGYNGENLGLKISDEQSGDLTLCVSTINADNNSSIITIDIRYPISYKKEYITNKIMEAISSYNLKLEIISKVDAIYTSENSELVLKLKEAYKNVTDKDATLYSIGGGSYTRQLFNTGVIFGPMFSDENRIHDNNENFNIKEFMLHAQICLEAMYKIFTGK